MFDLYSCNLSFLLLIVLIGKKKNFFLFLIRWRLHAEWLDLFFVCLFLSHGSNTKKEHIIFKYKPHPCSIQTGVLSECCCDAAKALRWSCPDRGKKDADFYRLSTQTKLELLETKKLLESVMAKSKQCHEMFETWVSRDCDFTSTIQKIFNSHYGVRTVP